MRRGTWLGLLLVSTFIIADCDGGSDGRSAKDLVIHACASWWDGNTRQATELAKQASSKDEKYDDLADYLQRYRAAYYNAEERGTLAEFFDTRDWTNERCDQLGSQFPSLGTALLQCFGSTEPSCVERKLEQASK